MSIVVATIFDASYTLQGMDVIGRIIEAHRAYLLHRDLRDRLIRDAVREGHSGYAIARAMRVELGDEALAQNTIRLISRKPKKV